MQNKLFLLLSASLVIFLFSCVTTGPDTGVTQLTTRCGNETRMLLDCKKDYDQFARTFRADVGIVEQNAYATELIVKKPFGIEEENKSFSNWEYKS